MKKIILFFFMFFLLSYNVKANVICNDGYISSCKFSRPGCCSHHGGIFNNAENYKQNNIYEETIDEEIINDEILDDENELDKENKNILYFVIVIIILFIFPFTISYIMDILNKK